MKIKSVIAALTAVLMLATMSACGKEKVSDETTADEQQTVSEQGQTGESETQEEETTVEKIQLEMPTNAGGTLENSNLVVTDITAYDRKSNGDLVKETAKKKLGLKKATVEKDGEEIEAYVATYNVSEDADTVFFSLVCSLNDIADIALGREFKREDGDDVLETKYEYGTHTYPLIITVKF